MAINSTNRYAILKRQNGLSKSISENVADSSSLWKQTFSSSSQADDSVAEKLDKSKLF